MGNSPIVLVDGANVAYIEKTHDNKPKMSNIVAVCKTLREKGFKPLVIVDASFRHSVDDPDQLEALIDNQELRQSPAGTEADYFLLETAQETGAAIVSNDTFTQYHDQYNWIKNRRVPVMIINGNVVLHDENLENQEARSSD
jgi:hypothetical protein